ncbi:serine/threonine protein kinase [Paenibacillus sp. BIHB 4019]|uniref:Serine/threonine protein kinase n=1 Tax=Paenibacillus sp. BIHB 4019 TaxID=1870819 RepID=A0A1B2DFJ8_9BACL|nr:protein kinase [Paenibacillus sp. BIHB 4019]ANY66488.1 serine/threonine protein kinase [Paenibacillus sp. BIHB 4019]
MTTSFRISLRRGTVVTGKWKRRKYRVERLLGEGANGKVYLVHSDQGWVALKVGADAVDLQSEINVLQTLAKQGRRQAPAFLYDVDDLQGSDGRDYPFYIMKYVRGVNLSAYLLQNGKEWFPLVSLNLLNKLAELHSKGWVFCDLKMENVMVADYGHVELVDYGGVTAVGKSIRQFTEIYDRGYWNAGSRAADLKYDLFSFAVLCIQMHDPKRLHQLTLTLLPQNRSTEDLEQLIATNASLKPIAGWLAEALAGRYADAAEGAEAWRLLMHRTNGKQTVPTPFWLKGLVAGSAIMLAVSVYWLLRVGM